MQGVGAKVYQVYGAMGIDPPSLIQISDGGLNFCQLFMMHDC